MRMHDVEEGKFYRVVAARPNYDPPIGAVLVGTKDDFVFTDDIDWGDSEYRSGGLLAAIVVWSPRAQDFDAPDWTKPGYTLYRDWDFGFEVEEIQFHLEGLDV